MTHLAWTKQGQLAGEAAAHGVRVFRGIPYAKPPVAGLRFRAPEPPQPWSGTRSASAFGPAAVQERGLAHDLEPRSEDCLYLNVWTPRLDTQRRAVLFWIHGGGFTSGASSQELYDGVELASRGNVVLVTFNYRLGVLGSGYLRDVLGVRGEELPANLALLDQIAALEWVRDNIAGFGGDPENVTIFGESAGGMSVGALLAVPRARRLFLRAIAQSGAAHHALEPDQASIVAEAFLSELGASAPARLWTASAEEILVAQRVCAKQLLQRGPPGKLLPSRGFPLMPVIDGTLLPEHPLVAIAAGRGHDGALLVGTNWDEWNYFLFLNEADKRDMDETALAKIAEARLPGRGAEAVALYRGVLGAAAPPWAVYSALESDRMFRVPALRLADAHAASERPTFGYLFDYRSELFRGQMGACHALEIPFVFGTLGGTFGRTFTQATEPARVLSRKMLDAWAQFARSGDPSHEGLGAWSHYDPSTRPTMRLGLHCGIESDPLSAYHPFWSDLL